MLVRDFGISVLWNTAFAVNMHVDMSAIGVTWVRKNPDKKTNDLSLHYASKLVHLRKARTMCPLILKLPESQSTSRFFVGGLHRFRLTAISRGPMGLRDIARQTS